MPKDELWDDSDACQVCGKALPNDCYWGIRKYCSKSCNAKAYRLRHLERIRREQRIKQRHKRQAEADAAPPRYCACGAVIPNWTRRDKVWCTPLCNARGGRIGNGICEGCGARFKPRGIVKRYCTPECQRRTWLARKEAEAGIVREGRTCVGCGVPIPASARPNKKWCARACYHRVWWQRNASKKARSLPVTDRPLSCFARRATKHGKDQPQRGGKAVRCIQADAAEGAKDWRHQW